MDVSTSIASMKHVKISWPEKPSKKQNWLLPDSMIFYIAKNPSSSKVYQKLIQSCKYFFEKNPVLIVTKLESCEEKDGINTIMCPNEYCECINNAKKCCIKFDLKKLKLSSKIWVTHELYVVFGVKNYTSLLCIKLFRCEADHVYLNEKTVKYDDFKLFTSTAKSIILSKNLITYKDGSIVMFDKILECLPKVEMLEFTFDDEVSIVNASTMEIIPNLPSLEEVGLHEIPETLNIGAVNTFIKKYKKAKFQLFYNKNISLEFKNQLESHIVKIIKSNVRNCLIKYDGQDREKFRIMIHRFFNFMTSDT
uniref:Uncharacterized protein n=1 Tax=Panagrolaimus sp. PS1159 TaxID=55785 RepID=A0AC35GNN6_9BILA